MTLGIHWGDEDSLFGGLIYLDAVTSYTRNHAGQLTKHPIDGGGNITDFFIRENDKYSITAVISGVDISTGIEYLYDEFGTLPYNAKYRTDAVSVNSSDRSVISKMLPASLTQFVGTAKPEVTLSPENPDHTLEIQSLLEQLASGEQYNQDTGRVEYNIQLVNLYEFNGPNISSIKRNFVITSVSFNESADTGEGLYCQINLEEAHIVGLREVKVPSDVIQSAASEKAVKGKQDSTPEDPNSEDNKDSETKKERVSTAAQAYDSGADLIKQLTGAGE